MAAKKPAIAVVIAPMMHTKKSEKKESMKMEKKEGPGMEKRERMRGIEKPMSKMACGGKVKGNQNVKS